MKSRGIRTFIVLAALTSTGLAETATGAVSAQVVEFGTYVELPQTVAGLRVKLLRESTTVEACVKSLFGYRVHIVGLAPGSQVEFKKVVTHPPITPPSGKTSTGFTAGSRAVTSSEGSVSVFQGFAFDYDYELAPGTWTIEFWYGSQMLSTKSFDVVPCTAGGIKPAS